MIEQQVVRPLEEIKAELNDLSDLQAAMNPWEKMADDLIGLVYSATDGKLGRQSMMDRGINLFVEAGDANWERLKSDLKLLK